MWLDQKYISLLSSSLPLFKEVGDGVYNFRCVFCGDSDTNRTKARGYLIERDGKYFSYCHNCHESHQFPNFLKHVNLVLYDQYLEEKLVDKPRRATAKAKPVTSYKNVNDMGIPSVMWLDLDHPARMLLDARKVPSRWHSSLFYAENFNKFANKHIPNKYNPEHAEARLVIPLRSRSGKLMGFQGRAIEPSAKIRYVTGLLAKDNPKLFNMDLVDLNRTNYVVEGPIDAMMLENAFAVCGGALINELEKNGINSSQTVVVYDNEPRNDDIVRQIIGAAKKGYKIVVWPERMIDKDINDMVLSGIDVEKTLAENTYQGLEAELQLATWRKKYAKRN